MGVYEPGVHVVQPVDARPVVYEPVVHCWQALMGDVV